MEEQKYQEIALYLSSGKQVIPEKTSSKSNFKKKANLYSLNLYGNLIRGGKIVLRKKDLPTIW